MIQELKKYYNPNRLEQVDPDFLTFEEEMAPELDIERLLNLINGNFNQLLPNPHNSILLYLVGISNEFDFKKGRSNTVGGTPPDCR